MLFGINKLPVVQIRRLKEKEKKKTPDVPRSPSAQMFDDVFNNLKAKFEKKGQGGPEITFKYNFQAHKSIKLNY